MPWSDPLSKPITLKDGRVLVTLRDAGKLFAGFSESVQSHKWVEYAVELLLLAAENSDARTVGEWGQCAPHTDMGGSDMRVMKIFALICALGLAASSAAFAQTSDSMSHSKMMMHHHPMMIIR
jgi:hypothetical protein